MTGTCDYPSCGDDSVIKFWARPVDRDRGCPPKETCLKHASENGFCLGCAYLFMVPKDFDYSLLDLIPECQVCQQEDCQLLGCEEDDNGHSDLRTIDTSNPDEIAW